MSGRFNIRDTPICGLKIIERKPVGDNRGFLERMFCSEELGSLLLNKRIVQINHSLTVARGTIRGMHFQYPPDAETKIVSCLRGEIFDVAVDLRRGSPTFLGWHGEALSAGNHKTMLIPEGFAHGFQTLTENCELLYLHTAPWQPRSEAGLNAQDARLGIRWPHPVSEVSTRDAAHPLMDEGFPGITL